MVRFILYNAVLLSMLVSAAAFVSLTHPRTIRQNAFRLEVETRFSIEQIYREPEAVQEEAIKEDSYHAAKYSGSYNGLTRPTQAMAWLGVAIAGGLVAYSPDFLALDLVSGVDFWSLDLSGDELSSMRVPLSTVSAATATMDLLTKLNLPDLASMDWSVFGVSDVAKEYHLQNLASWPSVDAKSMMESWALQHKEAVLSHLDSTLQALPTVDDFQKGFDTTELVQTVQSKVTAFQTAFQGRVQAMDLDLSARASAVEAAYKSQMAQLETYKEPVLQQEKVWSLQLAQVPTELAQWTATVKSQVQTLLSEAMPQYGRDIAGQFQAVLPKEMPEMKMSMPQMKASMPEFALPHQLQELKMPEISIRHEVKEISIPEISIPQIKEIDVAPKVFAKPAFATPPVVESYQSQMDRMTESLLMSK